MKDYKNIKTFDELVEFEHGKIGTESRNKYEEGAQMFIVSEMLKAARKEAKLTQRLAVTASPSGAVLDHNNTYRNKRCNSPNARWFLGWWML